MQNYDYSILSPDEFERFCRDILQKVLRKKLESFATGKDGGIDFRYSKAGKSIIIQCKNYKNFASLYFNLKKEVPKARKINPNRYILTTNVSLTPKNKDIIKKLFDGIIKDEKDILGKDDLNNYISIYPAIEKKYYKLWIASTTVLNKILHSRVVNQSEIEKANIKKNLQIFVQNNSFIEAMEILKKLRFVLISGIPGIGKTTLARFLVYYLLGSGMDEFVFISDSINDAFELYDSHKKQVFLFDDFLGKRNFTKSSLATNEDRRIIDFIDMIHKSRNKYLIFTTREYILRQARIELETLNELSNDNKCIVDLEKYNRVSKGKILYNHLYFNGLPIEYIKSVIKNDLFFKIIDHDNFSPRIIESVTKAKIWPNIQPEEFGLKFLEYMNNPEVLWKHAYENQISELSRCLLAVLSTTDTPILLNDLEYALQSFSKIHGKKYQEYSYFNFKNCLKELEDTFIRTQKDCNGNIIINFQNPSIHDFLCHYFNANDEILKDVLSAAIFFNQLVVSFTTNKSDHTRILLNKALMELIIDKILKEYDLMNLSMLATYQNYSTKEIFYKKINNSDILKIGYIIDKLSVREYQKLKGFLKSKIFTINISDISEYEINKYLHTISIIKDELLIEDIHEKLDELFDSISTTSELDYYTKVKLIDLEYFEDKMQNESSKNKIREICRDAFSNSSSDELEELKSEIDSLTNDYSINLDSLLSKVEEKIVENNENEKNNEYNASNDYRNTQEKVVNNEELEIRNMFDSLIVN